MGALVYFTLRDLIHDRWRSLLTILSLAVVICGYLLLSSLSQAFTGAGRLAQGNNNLVILSAGVIDPMDSLLDDQVLPAARASSPDQILRAYPTLFRHMTIAGRLMQVRSVPLEEMPSSLGLILVQGSWPTGGQQIVVSEEIARAASWNTGSKVTIYGRDFEVTGLVRTSASNTGAIWMTYEQGQQLFGTRHGFQAGYLVLAPSADPKKVLASLQSDPRFSGSYSFYLENTISDSYHQLNHNLVTLSGIMAAVSLLAISFGIYNSTSLSLTERSHEISLLRVMGFTQGRLRTFLVVRTLLLTLSAYWLGWVVLAVCFTFLKSNAPLGSSEAPLRLTLTASASVLGLGLAAVFSFLGVWLVSGRIATRNLLDGSE